MILTFFLRSNQTTIPMFFLCFVIICFTLQFLSKSCVFSILPFFQPYDSKGPLKSIGKIEEATKNNILLRTTLNKRGQRRSRGGSFLHALCAGAPSLIKANWSATHAVIDVVVLWVAKQLFVGSVVLLTDDFCFRQREKKTWVQQSQMLCFSKCSITNRPQVSQSRFTLTPRARAVSHRFAYDSMHRLLIPKRPRVRRGCGQSALRGPREQLPSHEVVGSRTMRFHPARSHKQ